MTIMSRIRQNMAVVIIIVAVALIGFVLTDFLGSLGRGNAPGQAPPAGVVAGESITFAEYNNRVENVLAQQQGAQQSDDQTAQVRNQVWTDMVNDIIFQNEYEKIGLSVSGEELYDQFAGPNPHPVVRQWVQPWFDQNQRQFTPQNMQFFLEQAQNDEQLKQGLKEVEDYIAKDVVRNRYLNLVGSGYVGSKALAEQKYLEGKSTRDIQFLSIPFSSIPDSTVLVEDSDLRAYMKKHAERYEQDEEATVIRYVKYDLKASREDSVRSYQKLMKKAKDFADTDNDSIFTRSRSRLPFLGEFKPLNELPEMIQDSIQVADAKDVFGPFLDGQHYQLYKLVEKKEEEEAVAKLKHIVIAPEGSTAADTAAAKSKAQEIKRKANAGNFGELALENSKDAATRTNEGSLGWYSKGVYGPDFDEAVNKASKGSIIGPIESSRGFHIVLVEDKTNTVYSVANIEELIYPGDNTRDSIFRILSQVANDAQNKGSLQEAATAANIQSTQSAPLYAGSASVQGIPGSRSIVAWAIQAEADAISDIKSVSANNGGGAYVLAQVSQKQSKGLRDLESVRGLVQAEVLKEKKAEIIKQKLGSVEGKDLNTLQSAYGPSATVRSDTAVSFSKTSITGMGAEPYVIGLVAGMNQGETSDLIEGENGVYVVTVTRARDAAIPENAMPQIQVSKQQDRMSGQENLKNTVFRAMLDIAEVKDQRYLSY